jgi:hypothetical protein
MQIDDDIYKRWYSIQNHAYNSVYISMFIEYDKIYIIVTQFIYFAICFAFESKFSQSSGRCIDLDDDRRTSQNSHHMTWVLLPWSLLRLFSLLQLFFFDMKSMLLLGNWVWATVGITKGWSGQGQKWSRNLIKFVGPSSQRICKRMFSMPR